VTENWFFPGVEEPMLSGGLRFHGESLSFDLGAVRLPSLSVFLPWFGASVKF